MNTAIKPIKTTEEFYKHIGQFFHARLLEYLSIYASGVEYNTLKDEEVIIIDYSEDPKIQGKFSIKFGDLKAKAKVELEAMEKEVQEAQEYKEFLDKQLKTECSNG